MDFSDPKDILEMEREVKEAKFQLKRIKQFEDNKYKEVEKMYHGGGLQQGALALIGESASGRGGELVYSGSDAMVLNQERTDKLLTMALEKGLSGGGGNNAPTVITTDNSVRSNTSNMISSPSMITSNDSLMNSITNSV